MEAFQVYPPAATQQPSPHQPQAALCVRSNRQLQVWYPTGDGTGTGGFWAPQELQMQPSQDFPVTAASSAGDHHVDNHHHSAAATLVKLTADSKSDSVEGDTENDTAEEATAPSHSPSPTASPFEQRRAQDVREDKDQTLPQKNKRKFKKRKATHTIRKEQKAELDVEIQQLEAKLEALKFQTLVKRGEASHSQQALRAENVVLRESIQEQHLVMARARALLSSHAQQNLYGVRPTEMPVHLVADRAERRVTLSALRGPKLRDAMQFLRERSFGLNPTATYLQEERFDTEKGDYCVARFDVTPLRGVCGGAKTVFKALQHAAFNAEIIISETSGNITIREDDDLTDENYSQMRLVSATPHGVHFETNMVHFSEFVEAEGGCGGSYGLTVTDFVDEDELYPYRPLERVRRDVNSVMLITSYVEPPGKRGSSAEGAVGQDQSGEVVVITRWTCSKVCHTDLPISRSMWQDLHTNSVRFADTLLKCVRETLGLSTSSMV